MIAYRWKWRRAGEWCCLSNTGESFLLRVQGGESPLFGKSTKLGPSCEISETDVLTLPCSQNPSSPHLPSDSTNYAFRTDTRDREACFTTSLRQSTMSQKKNKGIDGAQSAIEWKVGNGSQLWQVRDISNTVCVFVLVLKNWFKGPMLTEKQITLNVSPPISLPKMGYPSLSLLPPLLSFSLKISPWWCQKGQLIIIQVGKISPCQMFVPLLECSCLFFVPSWTCTRHNKAFVWQDRSF